MEILGLCIKVGCGRGKIPLAKEQKGMREFQAGNPEFVPPLLKDLCQTKNPVEKRAGSTQKCFAVLTPLYSNFS